MVRRTVTAVWRGCRPRRIRLTGPDLAFAFAVEESVVDIQETRRKTGSTSWYFIPIRPGA